jgi:ketosteroid isomerase-like protein
VPFAPFRGCSDHLRKSASICGSSSSSCPFAVTIRVHSRSFLFRSPSDKKVEDVFKERKEMHLPVLRGVALVIFVLLATSFDSFAQHNNTTTDPQITQKIRVLSRTFDDAVNNNDAAAVAALFTEDGVLVSDRGPIHGRKAIENSYSGVFQVWHPRNHIGTPDGNDPHVSCFSGDEAWETGEWSETEQPRPSRPIQSRGYWSTVYIREGADWKIGMLIYNVTPAK